jgi:hypothetical protein
VEPVPGPPRVIGPCPRLVDPTDVDGVRIDPGVMCSSVVRVRPSAEFTIGDTAWRTPGFTRLRAASTAAVPSAVNATSARRRRTSPRALRANHPTPAQTTTSSTFRTSQTATTLSAVLNAPHPPSR